ncbi:MAG: hypothetical protein Q8R97_13910, partial [Brevundimonas sp.]|nr:hypothetical protein [Brevundimonas sp.]
MIRLSFLLNGRVAASALALGLTVSACATAPVGTPQVLPEATAGAFVADTGQGTVSAPARDDWWQLYDDPLLDALVLQALG